MGWGPVQGAHRPSWSAVREGLDCSLGVEDLLWVGVFSQESWSAESYGIPSGKAPVLGHGLCVWFG